MTCYVVLTREQQTLLAAGAATVPYDDRSRFEAVSKEA